VNIHVLIFAAPFIAATVLLLVYRKALRVAAVTGGFAILCVLVAVTPFRVVLVHLASSGIGLAVVVALVVGGALAAFFDILRGHHKKALNGRQGQGHHMRPFVGVSVFAVAVVLTAAVWHQYINAAGNGGGQVVNTILHPGA
jgi:uncharacterized membrane protein